MNITIYVNPNSEKVLKTLSEQLDTSYSAILRLALKYLDENRNIELPDSSARRLVLTFEEKHAELLNQLKRRLHGGTSEIANLALAKYAGEIKRIYRR